MQTSLVVWVRDPARFLAYGDAFAAIEGDPNTRLVVLVDDEQMIGTLQWHLLQHLAFRGGRCAQIEAVCVASHRRREGLGERLISWAVAEAERHGCHRIQLTTNAERTDAHRFYERLGFTASHIGMKRYLSGPVTGR